MQTWYFALVKQALTAYICKVSMATSDFSPPIPALMRDPSASSINLLYSFPGQLGVAPSPWRHLPILLMLTRVIFWGRCSANPGGILCFPKLAVPYPHPCVLFVIWWGQSFLGVVGSICPLESGPALLTGQQVEMTYVCCWDEAWRWCNVSFLSPRMLALGVSSAAELWGSPGHVVRPAAVPQAIAPEKDQLRACIQPRWVPEGAGIWV